MTDVEPVIQQLRAQVKRGGFELLSAFRAFDHLRTGRIDLNRFRSVLDNQRLLRLTDLQLLALHKEYKSAADPTKIDYTRFVIDVENIPSFDNRMPQPRTLAGDTAFGNTGTAALSATAHVKPLSEEVQRVSEYALDRLRAATNRARLDPEAALRAHDRYHNGTCPITKLGSALSSVGLVLSQQELEALIERYRVSDTSVSYAAFLNDLRQPIVTRKDELDEELERVNTFGYRPRPDNSPAATFSTLSTSAAPSGPVVVDTNVGTVLRKLHYIAGTKRIQFDVSNNEFRPFDRLGKGVVDEETFKRVLAGAYRMEGLTNSEVEALIRQYAVADPAFASPDATMSQDFLSARTEGRLTAVAGNLRLVDYRAFIADLTVGQMGGDLTNLEKEPTRIIDPSAIGKPWSPEDENEVKVAFYASADQNMLDANRLQDLLERLAVVTDAQRLELESQFKDRDPLRSGCVNPRQFRTVVSSVPLATPFNEEEWALLLASYQRGTVGIGYRGFLADLQTCEKAIREAKIQASALAEEYEEQRIAEEQARATKSYLPRIGQEGAKLASNLNAATAAVMASAMKGSIESSLSPQDLAQLAERVVARIKNELNRRRLTIRAALRAHDTSNHGLLHVNRMHSVLSREALIRSTDEMAALAAKYSVPASGAPGSTGIRYLDFLEDVGDVY